MGSSLQGGSLTCSTYRPMRPHHLPLMVFHAAPHSRHLPGVVVSLFVSIVVNPLIPFFPFFISLVELPHHLLLLLRIEFHFVELLLGLKHLLEVLLLPDAVEDGGACEVASHRLQSASLLLEDAPSVFRRQGRQWVFVSINTNLLYLLSVFTDNGCEVASLDFLHKIQLKETQKSLASG